MDNKIMLIIIILIILVVSIVVFYFSQSTKRFYQIERDKSLKRTKSIEKSYITENDIAELPLPVQKYLKYVGVIGKEKVYNVKIISLTDINLGGNKGWVKMYSEEYDFYDTEPTRLAKMNFKTNGVLVVGLDSYLNGHGNMLIKPLGLFKVADAKGHIMDDTSALAMFFLSMCANAPSTLIDKRIKWKMNNLLQVEAKFTDNDLTITAILDFNETGQLIKFSTEDKYYSPRGDSYEKVLWTSHISNYHKINELLLSTYGEAIWSFPNGDECYGKVTLQSIQYNVK